MRDAHLLVYKWDEIGDARQNVLIELVYNIGLHSAMGFKMMRAAIDRGDYAVAAAELLNSQWRQDVGDGRATTLAKQLETGEFA